MLILFDAVHVFALFYTVFTFIKCFFLFISLSLSLDFGFTSVSCQWENPNNLLEVEKPATAISKFSILHLSVCHQLKIRLRDFYTTKIHEFEEKKASFHVQFFKVALYFYKSKIEFERLIFVSSSNYTNIISKLLNYSRLKFRKVVE